MAKLRIIARYTDGRMFKGHTENFNPTGAIFNLHPIDSESSTTTGVLIAVKDLKAIFVVKEFVGNPDNVYKGDGDDNEKDNADPVQVGVQPIGTVLRITFKDGEQLLGSSMTYDPSAVGFFVFPVDPDSNNLRVFVINDFVKTVDYVDLAKAG